MESPSQSIAAVERRIPPLVACSSVRGFTLIELMVVIFILSLSMMLVFPLLPSTEAGNLHNSARSLASTLRYLGDKATATKTHYRLHLNFADNSVTIGRMVGGEETAPDDTFLGKRPLASGVTLQDVIVPRLGRVTEGEVIISFSAAGQEEFVIIHLRATNGSTMTITAFPHTGKVQVADGYQEAKL